MPLSSTISALIGMRVCMWLVPFRQRLAQADAAVARGYCCHCCWKSSRAGGRCAMGAGCVAPAARMPSVSPTSSLARSFWCSNCVTQTSSLSGVFSLVANYGMHRSLLLSLQKRCSWTIIVYTARLLKDLPAFRTARQIAQLRYDALLRRGGRVAPASAVQLSRLDLLTLRLIKRAAQRAAARERRAASATGAHQRQRRVNFRHDERDQARDCAHIVRYRY